MSKPETNYRISIEKRLPKELHHEKMANPYSGGTADSWYSGNKSDLWVEWKWAEFPKRGTTMIVPSLSGLQRDWLKGRYEEGRNVLVIVGTASGGHIFISPLSWESGIAASQWANLSRDQVAQWIVKVTMR